MSNRLARVIIVGAGVLALTACVMAPPVDGRAPGATLSTTPEAHDLAWTNAGIWLAILAVAGLLAAGVLLLVSGRRTGR